MHRHTMHAFVQFFFSGDLNELERLPPFFAPGFG